MRLSACAQFASLNSLGGHRPTMARRFRHAAKPFCLPLLKVRF